MREKIEIIELQPEQKEKTLTCMAKLYQSLEFFYQLVNDDNLSKENVKTHMGLFESYFTELSDILGYDSVIAEERKKRYKEIRTLQEQLRESLAEQSKTITTDLLTEKLNHLDGLFRAWYSSLGFHYASQEKITQRMFLYTVTQKWKKNLPAAVSQKNAGNIWTNGGLFQSTKEKTGTFLKINSMTNYSILIKTEKTWKIFMKNIFQDSGSGNLKVTGMIMDILSCAIRYMCRLKQSRI